MFESLFIGLITLIITAYGHFLITEYGWPRCLKWLFKLAVLSMLVFFILNIIDNLML
jgi:hypothetical protein